MELSNAFRQAVYDDDINQLRQYCQMGIDNIREDEMLDFMQFANPHTVEYVAKEFNVVVYFASKGVIPREDKYNMAAGYLDTRTWTLLPRNN